MRPKLDGGIGAEKFAHEKFERAFQVRDADVLIDVKTFDLMKLRAMRRVHFVATISRAGGNHANWRRRGLHRANLDGGSVGAEQSAVGQIKCVLLVARRMFRRRVQGTQAIPFAPTSWTVP